jgi:cephalosporin hydroxylase
VLNLYGRFRDAIYRRTLGPFVRKSFHRDLIESTQNFRGLTWLGHPIWQNILDLWTMQEVMASVRPELLIECGTNRGGSSLFFAHLMDLTGYDSVITIDVEKMHDLSHPRITYLLGSSVEPKIVNVVSEHVRQCQGPILLILDSDHSSRHVLAELQAYAAFVTPGSYCLVQDGVIDVLPMYRNSRPGPLHALEQFLATTNDFEIDHTLCDRFLITHHPNGWLRRK